MPNIEASKRLLKIIADDNCNYENYDDQKNDMFKAIEDGADINYISQDGEYKGLAAIHIAAAKSESAIIKYLVLKGADINLTTNQHYGQAEQNDQEEISDQSTEYGSEQKVIIIPSGSTPLHIAVIYGCEKTVEYFLAQNNINLDIYDSNDQNICQLAISDVKLDIFKAVIRHSGFEISQLPKKIKFKKDAKYYNDDFSEDCQEINRIIQEINKQDEGKRKLYHDEVDNVQKKYKVSFCIDYTDAKEMDCYSVQKVGDTTNQGYHSD